MKIPALTVEEARVRLADAVAPLGTERCALADSADRILAEPVVSPRAQPPAATAAMDGYAVRSSDIDGGEAVFRLVGAAPAGAPFGGRVGAGETVRIFTGGLIPPGADRVVVQEQAEALSDGDVRLRVEPGDRPHIREAGIDFAAGDTVCRAGERLTPARLMTAAGANAGAIVARKRARIAVFASGDEIVEPGAPLTDEKVVNSGSYGVAALVKGWGGDSFYGGVLPDAVEAAADRLGAVEADLRIVIGGASVGDRDVARPAAARIGLSLAFAGVAVRPGKPVWFAEGDGAPVLGLPGNPASALVCAHLFARVIVDRFHGLAYGSLQDQLRPVALGGALAANGPRETFLRATLRWEEAGRIVADVDPRQDSALMTPFAAAQALVRRAPGAPAVEAGGGGEALILGARGLGLDGV